MNTTGVRVLFAAAVLSLPVQLLLERAVGEPYPGLYQPGFGYVAQRDDAVRLVEPEVVVTYADGGREALDATEALPPDIGVLPQSVLKTVGRDERVATDPRTRAWWAERLGERAPGRVPVEVVVRWVEVRYALADRTRTVDGERSRLRLDLRDTTR